MIMNKVDLCELWTEFNNWLCYIKQQKHEIQQDTQYLNRYVGSRWWQPHSTHLR